MTNATPSADEVAAILDRFDRQVRLGIVEFPRYFSDDVEDDQR